VEPFDSPEEAAFRSQAREFLAANAETLPERAVAPSAIVAEWSSEEELERLEDARRWQHVKFAAGWAGIAWPSRYGGRDGTLIQELIFRQEESQFDVPHDALVVGTGWCGRAVLQHGSETQRSRFIEPLLSGEHVWCQLFSEPGAGSDLAGLATTATQDGDEWVLNGQKVWTTFAHRSDWGLCIARHDPEAAKHRGLSAFMVDMRSDGITARPLRQMTGSANFNEVFLDEVRVPDEYRIGGVGDGWGVVITTFIWERLSLLGLGFRTLGALRSLISELGRSDDPVVRDRYARIYTRAEALRLTGMRLLTDIAHGRMPGPEGSTVKLAATDLLDDAYGLAMDLFQAAGTLGSTAAPWGGEWHTGFLGSPGLRIGGGTDAVQRNIIGERVLGLPGDIRIDKDIPFSAVPRN
jgi:alkylation response protein AidB-like acyl-CoA dehydrogenase